jgi:hypothetical protein
MDRGREKEKEEGEIKWRENYRRAETAGDSQQKRHVLPVSQQTYPQAGKDWWSLLIQRANWQRN